jgi:hypothetical protein
MPPHCLLHDVPLGGENSLRSVPIQGSPCLGTATLQLLECRGTHAGAGLGPFEESLTVPCCEPASGLAGRLASGQQRVMGWVTEHVVGAAAPDGMARGLPLARPRRECAATVAILHEASRRTNGEIRARARACVSGFGLALYGQVTRRFVTGSHHGHHRGRTARRISSCSPWMSEGLRSQVHEPRPSFVFLF